MLHARPDYNRFQDPLGLIPEDEPVFLVRGQDKAAPATLDFWATEAGRLGADAKITSVVREHAELMREYQKNFGSKVPDLPTDGENESNFQNEESLSDTEEANYIYNLLIFLGFTIDEAAALHARIVGAVGKITMHELAAKIRERIKSTIIPVIPNNRTTYVQELYNQFNNLDRNVRKGRSFEKWLQDESVIERQDAAHNSDHSVSVKLDGAEVDIRKTTETIERLQDELITIQSDMNRLVTKLLGEDSKQPIIDHKKVVEEVTKTELQAKLEGALIQLNQWFKLHAITIPTSIVTRPGEYSDSADHIEALQFPFSADTLTDGIQDLLKKWLSL